MGSYFRSTKHYGAMQRRFPMHRTPSGLDSLPFETATVGGTFHAMHIGHKRYLEIAFAIARWVYIHITNDEFANSLKPYRVKPYDIRHRQMEGILTELGWRH